ncbi:MAG: aromatic prenyltransferase [Actinoallomurus sp.]
MSGAAEVGNVYSAIEESARLLDVACSRDNVVPILTAYGDALTDSVIVFSMATGKRHAGELDYSFVMLPKEADPYKLALSNGLIPATDHPVGALPADIDERCPVESYGADFGVVGGFKKTYSVFPVDDLQSVSKLAEIPSMPRSVADNADLFARYGLGDKVKMIGIDYLSRTMNLYFAMLPPEFRERESLLPMLSEMGLPEPSEQLLEFAQNAFSVYPTLSWDSSKIERICFAGITAGPVVLPAQIDPEVDQFARSAPYAYTGNRVLVHGNTLSPDGEYYKLGSYYQLPAHARKLMVTFDVIEEE